MKNLLYILLMILSLSSCKQDLDKLEKYLPPPWLKGKLYSQIEADSSLSTFSQALILSGFDTIVNTSGLFTIFAPDDDAFTLYFKEHPEYGNDLNNIPLDELKALVSFHIVQNSWSKQQLVSLNLDGWIDNTDTEVRTRAFKKETLLRKANKEYSVRYDEEFGYLISTDPTSNKRMVYSLSRKFVPVFFAEYFDTYGIPSSDYAFYFNREFDGGIYFAGARVINEEEIPAENGYVYIIDRVVEPLSTAEELLEKSYDGFGYSDFLELFYKFPEFTVNLDATYQQAGAEAGANIDTLFNLSFPELAFNINSEITGPSNSSTLGNIQYHHGMLAPTNQAFSSFIASYVAGPNQWGSLDNMPRSLKSIIINSYMSNDIVYASDVAAGFMNEERDEVFLDESNIVQKEFGSNASFIGLDEAIVPRAFSSVSAPVYLRRGYFTFLTAIEETNILDALKRTDQYYSFFVIPDQFSGTLLDSSLMVKKKGNKTVFEGYNRSTEANVSVSVSDLRKKILNHVGISVPKGIADIEFVKNLAGNYLVFDNANNRVSGTAPTTYGLNGDSLVEIEPVLLEEYTDNGVTYKIDTWFSFSNSPMSSLIYSINSWFMGLLEDAGLAKRIIGDEYDLTFLSQGTSYTAFIPTPAALSSYNTDTLSNTELEQFLRNHFVPNKLIFTDGSAAPAYYSTMNTGSSNSVYIHTEPDKITIRNKSGNNLISVDPNDLNSNLISTTKIGNTNITSEWNFISTGVVHAVDTVFISSNLY